MFQRLVTVALMKLPSSNLCAMKTVIKAWVSRNSERLEWWPCGAAASLGFLSSSCRECFKLPLGRLNYWPLFQRQKHQQQKLQLLGRMNIGEAIVSLAATKEIGTGARAAKKNSERVFSQWKCVFIWLAHWPWPQFAEHWGTPLAGGWWSTSSVWTSPKLKLWEAAPG